LQIEVDQGVGVCCLEDFLVNNGEKMMQLSYDNLEFRASPSTGKYIVKVFNEASTTAEKECDLSDNFGELYDVFPYEDLPIEMCLY
jgi:hypothetical protein